MLDLSDCILLGTITKLHGIHGQVILKLNNIDIGNILIMESVFLEIDGLPVPFFVSEYSEKATTHLIIGFEDIHNESKAQEIIDAKVFIRSSCVNRIPEQYSDLMHLIGYTVIDKNSGELGILKDIIDIHQNPLLCVSGTNKEILIPATPEFILETDAAKKVIRVESPKGLTELS